MASSNSHYIGAHFRLKDTFLETLEAIETSGVHYFQFFASRNVNKKTVYLEPSIDEQLLLNKLLNNGQDRAILHASYWINAASCKDEAYKASKSLLKKEITLAKTLNISTIVLHPGTANGLPLETPAEVVRQQGILRLVDLLNEVLENQDITILLENTAHGRNAIGSNFSDFLLIKNLLAEPNKVFFCLDTAHAFAYGYNVTELDTFLKELDDTVGFNQVKLIHLNDVEGVVGCRQDKHTIPGEGQIGLEILQKITNFPTFSMIPKIIELPTSEAEIIQGAVKSLSFF